MDAFERLLQEHRGPVERYVKFRIPGNEAEDVFQEALVAAYRAYPLLADPARFKPWLLGIARHKCADWLRRKYRLQEVPLAQVRAAWMPPRFGPARDSLVSQTMERLPPQDQEVLRLCYWRQMPQEEMARRLGIPLGTVKSRLHTARERFRAAYPMRMKGDQDMQHIMPEYMPKYAIVKREEAPFRVKWEEMMGWFIVPRLGEKLTWAMYDDPDGRRTEVDELTVTGRAMVHGIEGVEIAVKTWDAMDCNQIGGKKDVDRTFVAQLTDTHCRALSETHVEDGIKRMYTFLDGDSFLDNWGFGENNCGNETDLRVKGDIQREGDTVTSADKPFVMDVVGRYDVTIGGKTWDTVCLMDLEAYVDGMATEQYIDKNGRTVLWRRFNAADWHGKDWLALLPGSQRITVNGRTFVHWYDCITSYIL